MRVPFSAVPFALAALAGLAACSDHQPEQIRPAAELVAALPPGRPAIYAAALEGPEPFVRALYAVYAGDGRGLEPLPPGRDPIYGRTLNAMIGADFRKADGEAPFLNHDPICGCQDSGGLVLESVVVTESGATTAEAAVVFSNLGETHRQTLKLMKEGQSWRVVDVLVPGQPPLTEQLLKVID
ncbi:MAG: hypothetical protein ACI9YM_000945 [Brevundimonas sp.]|jgi:hypothetical protein|uniref:DUF3828 domain-containing protein n=1 Tax=Brevundimonas sp. TaxID=1871086 RepID=UPI0039E52C92